jgi:DNA repair protein SbcC/Rad50
MKLRQLEIRLLPGIDEAFTVDFQPDAVNVITGPNASGKSSLVRAVRALLYPEQKRGTSASSGPNGSEMARPWSASAAATT